MARITLTSRPASRALLGIERDAFAVVAKGYPAPVDLPILPLADLLGDPVAHLRPGRTMVVVGLSRLLTPSNRVQRGQVLLRPWPGVTRLSVDRWLFLSEPWRLWWHFFATRTAYLDFPDSFRAESTYRRCLDHDEPCPFRWEEVQRWGRGHLVTLPHAPCLGSIVEHVHTTTLAEKAAYQEAKERAFTNLKTLPAILSTLSIFAADVYPGRLMPRRASLWPRKTPPFLPAPIEIRRTDLGVDRYLAGRLRHLVDLTNRLAEGITP